MKTRAMSWALALVYCAGCGGDDSDTPDAAAGPDMGPEATDLTATVGAYTRDADGNYVDTGRTLVIGVGVPCFGWTRTARGHEMIAEVGLPAVEGEHDHYNAAGESSYVDGVFTWVEFGPEHDQDAIDATCAAGVDGVSKSVTADDYFEDHGGLFLKLHSVE